MQVLDVATFGYAENLQVSVLSRFSFTTATTIQKLKNSFYNKNTVKSTAFLVVSLEKVVFRERNFQGNKQL